MAPVATQQGSPQGNHNKGSGALAGAPSSLLNPPKQQPQTIKVHGQLLPHERTRDLLACTAPVVSTPGRGLPSGQVGRGGEPAAAVGSPSPGGVVVRSEPGGVRVASGWAVPGRWVAAPPSGVGVATERAAGAVSGWGGPSAPAPRDGGEVLPDGGAVVWGGGLGQTCSWVPPERVTLPVWGSNESPSDRVRFTVLPSGQVRVVASGRAGAAAAGSGGQSCSSLPSARVRMPVSASNESPSDTVASTVLPSAQVTFVPPAPSCTPPVVWWVTSERRW